jgi:GNAT superfamily N-acetyltransferase
MNCLRKNIEPVINGSEYTSYQTLVGPVDSPLASGSIRLLDWDTRFFGFPCARVENLTATGDLNQRRDNAARVVSGLLKWSQSKSIQFLAAKIPADPALAQALEQCGFYLTDTAMGFTLKQIEKLPQSEPPAGYDFLENPGNAETIASAFSSLFWDGRFHHDPAIEKTTADRLWQEAVKNQLAGDADMSFLLTYKNQPAGLVTVAESFADKQCGCLFIVGLRESHQRKGLGRILLTQAVNRASDRFKQLEVETSTYNLPAIRLYQSVGFQPNEARLSFHCWQGK